MQLEEQQAVFRTKSRGFDSGLTRRRIAVRHQALNPKSFSFSMCHCREKLPDLMLGDLVRRLPWGYEQFPKLGAFRVI